MDIQAFLQCIRNRKSKDPFLFMGASNDILQVAPLTVCIKRPSSLLLMDSQRRLLMRNSRFYRNPFFLVDNAHKPMFEAMWKVYEEEAGKMQAEVQPQDVYLMASDSIQYDPMCVLESVVTAVYIYMQRKMTCSLLCPYALQDHPYLHSWLAALGLLDRIIHLEDGVAMTFKSVTLPPHAIELTTHNVEAFMRWTYLRDVALLKAPLPTVIPERILVLPQYKTPTEDAWNLLLYHIEKQNYMIVRPEEAMGVIHKARVVVMMGDGDAMQCLNMQPQTTAVFLLTPAQTLTHHWLRPLVEYVNVSSWKVLEMNPEEPYAFSIMDELLTL